MLRKQKKRGFTLIELSIVLIIISLIIASVLVGQDLVRAAEIRAVVTQYEQFNAAAGAFRTKYGQIPGDINNASNFFSGTVDGDGNGLVQNGGLNRVATTEITAFWQHLSLANLISGSYDGQQTATSVAVGTTLPRLKTGTGGWGVYAGQTGATAADGKNYFHLGVTASTLTDTTFTDVLTAIDAFGIDGKIDDGNPAGGVVTPRDGLGAVYNGTGVITPGVGQCMDTATTYDLDNAADICQIRIRMVY